MEKIIGDNPKRIRTRGSLGLLLAVPAFAALIIWSFIFSANGYVPKSLSEVMGTSEYVHPENDTATVCERMDCVEGWNTDVGTFMRFESDRKAEYVAYLLGDQARRNGTIVVDFGNAQMSIQQKADAVNLLFPGKDWY
jgi:hypothetical protein